MARIVNMGRGIMRDDSWKDWKQERTKQDLFTLLKFQTLRNRTSQPKAINLNVICVCALLMNLVVCDPS